MNNLLYDIKQVVSLSSAEEDLIKSKITNKDYAKKEVIVDYQSIFNCVYFVQKGCIQLCNISENGTEQTIQFSIRGYWLTDYDSFNYITRSNYQLKAISSSNLIMINRKDLDHLQTKIPPIREIF